MEKKLKIRCKLSGETGEGGLGAGRIELGRKRALLPEMSAGGRLG